MPMLLLTNGNETFTLTEIVQVGQFWNIQREHTDGEGCGQRQLRLHASETFLEVQRFHCR